MRASRPKRTLSALLLTVALAGLPHLAWADAAATPAPSAPSLTDALAAYSTSPLLSQIRERAESAIRHGANAAAVAGFVADAGADAVADRDALTALTRAERLAQSRLPVDPVLSRYLQGVAKRVPFARIEAVVDALETKLAESARRLDAVLPPPADAKGEKARLTAVDHGAYALSVGVPEATLDRSIRLAAKEARPEEAAQAPVLALGVLVASGVQPDRSWDVVRAAWESGYRGEDLERLGKALGRLSRDGQGAPPEVIDQVLSQIGGHAGRDQVFEGLDALCGEPGGGNAPPGLQKGQDPARDRPGQGGDRDRRDHGGGRGNEHSSQIEPS